MNTYILIVDDEQVVCEGTLNRIQRMKLDGIEGAAYFLSGEEALEYIYQNPGRQYLILVDITMPGICGLDLIRKIRELTERPRFIVLTAHEDFGFAQEALRLVVDDYLLKPVIMEQFQDTVLKSIRRINEEATERKMNSKQRLTDAMDTLAYGGQSELFPEFEREDGYGVWNQYAVCFMNGRLENEVICKDKYSILPFHKGKAFLLGYSLDTDMQQVVRDIITRLPAAHAGVSTGGVLQEIPNLYKEAERMFAASAFILGHSIIFAADESQKKASVRLSEQDRTALEKAIRCLDRNAFRKGMERFFFDGIAEEYQHKAIGELYTYVSQLIKNSASQRGLNAVYLPDNIKEFKGAANLRAALYQAFDKLCDSFTEKLGSFTLENSLKYINENLGNVDMAVIANHTDLSYTYFSEFFKKTMGINFAKYIHDLKMERARELLRSGKKISEVAEILGYMNPKNFTRVFKKHYGIAPSYWKSHH